MGEELRPAIIAATDEKLFRFRHSCIIVVVSHEHRLKLDNHLQLQSEANAYTPALLILHPCVAK